MFNPEVAIPQVWNIVQTMGNRDQVKIAGGAVCDRYFKKESRDIDVFVSHTADPHDIWMVINEYEFSPIVQEPRYKMAEDRYGNMRRVRIGSTDTHIVNAFKGIIAGYPVEIIIINEDVTKHIIEHFDQKIKSCWYDGDYHYSESFMECITKNQVIPNRHEAGGYIRAWLSADKYGLELSELYDLSKHYCGYAYHNNELQAVASDSTIRKIKGCESRLFNFDVDESNVILMDTFLAHAQGDVKLYEKLCGIANKEQLVEHPLAGTSLTVELDSTIDFKRFHEHIARALDEAESWEFKEISKMLMELRVISQDEFFSGKMIETNGRSVRIGKHLNKIMRQINRLDGTQTRTIEQDTIKATKIFEVRGVTNKAKVFFAGNKYALTHISTGTKWTSCQRWPEFGGATAQNHGLLANVSGNTIVAYVADERADYDSSQWKARILLQLGKNNEIFVGYSYSNRSEYNSFRQGLQLTLEHAGYHATCTQEQAMDFYSLKPMWHRPYNDMSGLLDVVYTNKGYRFKGQRKVIEQRLRAEAIEKTFIDFLTQQPLHFYQVSNYHQAAVIPIPEMYIEDAKWLLEYRFGASSYGIDIVDNNHFHNGRYSDVSMYIRYYANHGWQFIVRREVLSNTLTFWERSLITNPFSNEAHHTCHDLGDDVDYVSIWKDISRKIIRHNYPVHGERTGMNFRHAMDDEYIDLPF